MRKVLSWAMAVAMVLGLCRLCPAEKPKPIVTVSVSGYDELMKDINLIGKLGNFPQLGQMLEAGIQQAEGPKMLVSLIDKTKPWGAVMSMDAERPEPVLQAVIPLTDIKPIVKAMEAQGIGPKDLGDGVYEFQLGPQTAVVKQKGSWTLVANTKEALDAIPSDPVALLGGLNEKYSVAASIAVKNIPAAQRDAAMFPLMFGIQMATQQRMPGESPEQHALRSKMAQRGLAKLTEAIKDLDTVLIGVAVDRTANSARLDLVTTVLPESKTAKKLAKQVDLKSDFGGLADPKAAVVLTSTRKLDEEDIAETKETLSSLKGAIQSQLDSQNLPEAEAKLAKQVIDDLMAVLEKTIEGGKIDGGLMVRLAPKNLEAVVGMKIADGTKLNQVVKLVVERITKEEPGVASLVKLDAETYEGVRFHTFSLSGEHVQGTHDREMFSKLFGDKMEVILGIGDDSVYVAVSPDAAKTLKGVIDASKAAASKNVPPMQLSIALTPIAQFMAEVGDREAKEASQMILKAVSAGDGKDHLRLTATLVTNGSQARLELEEGVLRLVGSIPMMLISGHSMPAPQE